MRLEALITVSVLYLWAVQWCILSWQKDAYIRFW